MIVLDGVSKSFDGGQSYAVQELSLDVNDGETLVLLGSSGCGKTTTLKMINRLIEPTSRQEAEGMVAEAGKRAEVEIKPLEYFDRSVFTGRHMDTADYNPHVRTAW